MLTFAMWRDGHCLGLEPGERLPVETALAERFKVSLPTIRQAVGVLRSQGVVESKHGIGTFVQQDHRLERRSRCRYGRTRAVHRPRPHVDQHLLLRASKVLRLQASRRTCSCIAGH